MTDAMTDARERAAWLRLTLTPGVGPQTARELLGAFGLPGAVFEAGAAALARVVSEPLARTLAARPAPNLAAGIEAAERWHGGGPRRALLTWADPNYPSLLLASADPPPVLFAQGDLAALERPALAMVGARNASAQGMATAEAFAHTLAHGGLAIVSGLALGIDSAAHRGALRAVADGATGATIAVIGTGIDLTYPASNRALTEQIRAHGLVLSELPLGTAPAAHNFPRRNRILAGLAHGVLVVEAALRSGSLITARLAADLGREVFAIPGSIHSPMARGCHRLIRDGAKLVESAQDVLEELRLPATIRSPNLPQANTAEASNANFAGAPARTTESADAGAVHAAVLEALGHDPVDADALALRTGLATGTLSAVLLELELAQRIERMPGNRYQRLR